MGSRIAGPWDTSPRPKRPFWTWRISDGGKAVEVCEGSWSRCLKVLPSRVPPPFTLFSGSCQETIQKEEYPARHRSLAYLVSSWLCSQRGSRHGKGTDQELPLRTGLPSPMAVSLQLLPPLLLFDPGDPIEESKGSLRPARVQVPGFL